MNSIDDWDKNLDQIFSLLDTAKKNDPELDLCCFPENCMYFRSHETDRLEGISLADKKFKQLSDYAKTNLVNLHLGSVALQVNGKIHNASVTVFKTGEVKKTYSKMHLFDITLSETQKYKESDVYQHGEQPEILNLEGWHVGQTICYDIRFAEIFNWYASHSAEVILVPAAFLTATGKDHWEVLLRARAIESQAYIIASAQAGLHIGRLGKRETWGRSLIIDPWGHILAQGTPDSPDVLNVKLDLERINQVRRQIPMKNHRRLIQMKR